jgi:HTH-type transcriptional regulator, competence development regulator
LKFGPYLRHVRAEKLASGGSFSLRTVAKSVGIEPTYLSKIEREELPPPSEEVIVKLAAALGEDADVLLALGGKVSRDLLEIIRSHPQAFAALIRELRGHREEEIVHMTRSVRDGDW